MSSEKNNSIEIFTCPLCERSGSGFSKHHVIPKSRGGDQTIMICCDCHRQIHILFDNKELEENLGTIENLKHNEIFIKYLKWVKNKQIGVVKKPKKFFEKCKKSKIY